MWFDHYVSLLEKHNVGPHQIWNIDETGIQDQPHSEKLLLPRDGPKFQLVAGEKGQLTTILCASSASGMVANPTIIMKGKKVQTSWREGCPSNWNVMYSESGWITKAIMVLTGRAFLKFLQG